MKGAAKETFQNSVVRVGYGLDYPLDAAFDLPSVRVVGDAMAIIEGCRGLVDYAVNRITIDLGRYTASIYGSGLVMENLSRGAMNITGKISSISFDKRTV